MNYQRKSPAKVILIVLIVIVAAAVLAGACYYFITSGSSLSPYKIDEQDIARSSVEEIIEHLADDDDDDNDGLTGWFEEYFKTDGGDHDTDGDGLSDYHETVVLRTDPLDEDTDGNGTEDGDEDADGDGLTNIFEIDNDLNPMALDSDFDGYTDGYEFDVCGTDPANADSDGDGAGDGWEIEHGFDALSADTSFDVTESAVSVDGSSAAFVSMNLSCEQAETLHIEEIQSHYGLNESMPGYLAPAVNISVSGDFESAGLSFELDENLLSDPECQPVIYYFDPLTQTLEEQPTAVTGYRVTAEVTHFSDFIVLDKRHVDTDNPYGSRDVTEYEDVDFDGFLNEDDPNPFIWDISDRDLLMCCGIAGNNIGRENVSIDKLPQSRINELNGGFDGYPDATVAELKGWKILERWSEGEGFSATLFRKDNNVVLAFRGTQEGVDIFDNIDIYVTASSAQDEKAKAVIEEVLRGYNGQNIYLTGHSLGGHLAYRALSVAASDSDIKKTVTFNGLGMHPVFDGDAIRVLSTHRDEITVYKAFGDWVSTLALMETPGRLINCAAEFKGPVSDICGTEHRLYNFFNDVTPEFRDTKPVNNSRPPNPNPGATNAPVSSPGISGSPAPAPSATVEITGLTPNTAAAEEETTFTVTVSYTLQNTQSGEINAGANTDETDPDTVDIYAIETVGNSSGTRDLSFTCVPVRRADNMFVVYVDICLPGSSDVLASDAYSIALSGSSYSDVFTIEGKWKQTGEDTHGQMQRGSIIVFDGVNCNVWSPSDTYAFYEDDEGYRLDISGLLFATSMSYRVTVVDEDHIEIRPGSDSEFNTGDFTVMLMRVG